MSTDFQDAQDTADYGGLDTHDFHVAERAYGHNKFHTISTGNAS